MTAGENKNLPRKVKRYIQAHRLIEPGDRVLMAVSGGPDSMALMHLLYALAPELDCELAAAHLDHGLRAEAGMEAALVVANCQALGVKCYTRATDVAAWARELKTSLEDAGRQARYQFFRELAETHRYSRIATAHHYDDVAETVLLHLLRGTGITGLRGILPLNGILIRPLLKVGKAELQAYLEANNIPYCLDPSNEDPRYIRNRIRHYLIPYLQQEYNPRIVEGLNNLALIAQDEDEVLEKESLHWWRQVCLKEQTGEIVLDQTALAGIHPAYQRRIVRRALGQVAPAAPWNLEDVEKILALQDKAGSACTLNLKKGVRINKAYDKIIFTTHRSEKISFSHRITIPGQIDIPEIGASFHLYRVERANYHPVAGDVVLDFDRLPASTWLRSRREGDIFLPPGMHGSKKLKKWFIDAKIPVSQRDRIPLLAGAAGEIYAILGHGVARTVAVVDRTSSLLVIRTRPAPGE